MTTAREAVEESGLMDTLFSFELAAHIQADLDSEKGSWGWDPDVDGVVGFWIRNKLGAREVVVVLWLEQEDFDCNSAYADGVEL
jgi:hypothetical protein